MNFPDRLDFFSPSNSSKAWSWLSGSTWIFFVFELFEGVVDSTYTLIGSFPKTHNLSGILHSFWHCLLGQILYKLAFFHITHKKEERKERHCYVTESMWCHLTATVGRWFPPFFCPWPITCFFHYHFPGTGKSSANDFFNNWHFDFHL